MLLGAKGDLAEFDTAGCSESIGSWGDIIPASQGADGISSQDHDGRAAWILGCGMPKCRNPLTATRRRRTEFGLI